MTNLGALATAHAVIAWVSVVVLGACVVVVMLRHKLQRWLVPMSALFGLCAFATGAMLHLPFQSKLRQRLFVASATLGWLFERKEHAAFGAVSLLVCGVFALWVARDLKGPESGEGAEQNTARAGGDKELNQAALYASRAGQIALVAALAFELFALGVSVAVRLFAGERGLGLF